MSNFLTAAFYKFVALPDFGALRTPLLDVCTRHDVLGNILLAEEGINGTVAGPADGVEAVLAWLRGHAPFADLQHKAAQAERQPFYRMKVRLKREIVSMGVPDVSPTTMAGQYVKPHDWNRLLDDPEVVVIDVRNDYEIGIGSFDGAINPHTASFTELPEWVRQAAAPGRLLANKPKVAMFCTGGIRCEKSTALLRAQGFEEVFHLEGGILKYLETVPASESRWHGQCFVFDERVSVGHGLVPGDLELCRSCRHPLGDEERASPYFVRGVSCARCHDRRTEDEKRNLLERERQMALARERQQPHLGARQAGHKADSLPDQAASE